MIDSDNILQYLKNSKNRLIAPNPITSGPETNPMLSNY